MYDTELLQQELEGNSKYSKLLGLIEEPDCSVADLKKEFNTIKQIEQEDGPISIQSMEF